MLANIFALLAAASVVPAALAKIYITQPVQSTVWQVGTPVTVNWQDDNTAPNLAAIGVSSVGIYAGNQIQQTLLQQVGTLDVSKNNSITFQINGDIGPNNQHVYFIRFTSQGLMDPANPQYPEQAFSAMFAVSGSTATSFPPEVQAEVDGASTAGAIGGGAPQTAAPGAARTSTIVVVASNTAGSVSKPTGSAKAAAANATNSAGTTLSVPGMLVAGAAFAAFFL